jgi:hypothetical protein
VELDLEYAAPRFRQFLAKLPAGRYVIEYTDSTHLSDGQWEPLLTVEVESMDAAPAGLTQELMHPYYVVRFAKPVPVAAPEPSADVPPTKSGEKAAGNEASRASKKAAPESKRQEDLARKERVLKDQLGQCLARGGLLRPEFAPQEAADLLRLSREQALIFLPDTNALFNGTLHWLTQALRRSQIWIQPVAISLAQVQQRDAKLKSLVGSPGQANYRQALGSRTFVNATLGLLERLGKRYQVLEVTPELLRYMQPASRQGSDPDQGDVLEDRLLLEAIHVAWRSTRSRAERRVVTSDVLFARVLHAEGLSPLFLLPPSLPDEPVPCMRFEPLSQRFEGAPLPHLLWDMAHTFGTVRLRREEGEEVAQLSTYWPRKGFQDWTAERLKVRMQAKEPIPAPVPATAAPEHRFSNAPVPEVSLVTVLNLGGKLIRGPGTLEELAERFKERLGESTLRNAAEVLLRAGLATFGDGRLVATAALRHLEDALDDSVSDKIWSVDFVDGVLMNCWVDEYKGFEPYMRLCHMLNERGSLPLRDPASDLRAFLGNPSSRAYERLVRYPVYLAQAYTDGAVIRNGSYSPGLDQLAKEFQEVFPFDAEDGLAPVSKLKRALCRRLSVSPWKLQILLVECAEAGLLNDYVFEPAAAPQLEPPGDMVLRGTLDTLVEVPVYWDHIVVNGRPVFTIRRRAQP